MRFFCLKWRRTWTSHSLFSLRTSYSVSDIHSRYRFHAILRYLVLIFFKINSAPSACTLQFSFLLRHLSKYAFIWALKAFSTSFLMCFAPMPFELLSAALIFSSLSRHAVSIAELLAWMSSNCIVYISITIALRLTRHLLNAFSSLDRYSFISLILKSLSILRALVMAPFFHF